MLQVVRYEVNMEGGGWVWKKSTAITGMVFKQIHDNNKMDISQYLTLETI